MMAMTQHVRSSVLMNGDYLNSINLVAPGGQDLDEKLLKIDEVSTSLILVVNRLVPCYKQNHFH